jgi:hypothetical protein
MGTKSLDTLTSNLEQALKRLRSGGSVTRKRMALDEFFDHAVAEIAKAAEDEPDVAKRRLAALKRSVEEVIAQVAKMAAEDTDSESIQVEVATAFAPTRSDGDTPMADLTTAADQSSSETSLSATSAASADTAFAESLAKTRKALTQMKADLDRAPGRKTRSAAKKVDANGDEDPAADPGEADQTGPAGPDEWPLDLNTDTFLKGAAADAAALTWGADPEGVVSPKSR